LSDLDDLGVVLGVIGDSESIFDISEIQDSRHFRFKPEVAIFQPPVGKN
jgi:hypothetical protein